MSHINYYFYLFSLIFLMSIKLMKMFVVIRELLVRLILRPKNVILRKSKVTNKIDQPQLLDLLNNNCASYQHNITIIL